MHLEPLLPSYVGTMHATGMNTAAHATCMDPVLAASQAFGGRVRLSLDTQNEEGERRNQQKHTKPEMVCILVWIHVRKSRERENHFRLLKSCSYS